MRHIIFYILLLFLIGLGHNLSYSQESKSGGAFLRDSIIGLMYRVNDHFLDNQWKQVDRNWIRGTYYTGLMAFYKITADEVLLDQARRWAAKHGWRTGTEWIYPANRMTCVQTYLELYFIDPDEHKIEKARNVMDNRITNDDPASEQGWDYVDALYVGTPAYMMMSGATSERAYASYGHRMFRDVYNELYDSTDHLFYRDKKAKGEKSTNGKKVFWSRGNGWAMASITKILTHLPSTDERHIFYVRVLQEMAQALSFRQGTDGYWRVNLADSLEYTVPESSGTAFFTYAIAWGINHEFLDRDTYIHVINKSWEALYSHVSRDGKVLWGQKVARGPGKVGKNDSDEYVSGAFLLAGSEVIKLIDKKKIGN